MMIAHSWERNLKDVGDQALMRGLSTAFPSLRPGLSRSYASCLRRLPCEGYRLCAGTIDLDCGARGMVAGVAIWPLLSPWHRRSQLPMADNSDLPADFRTIDKLRDWLPIRREQCPFGSDASRGQLTYSTRRRGSPNGQSVVHAFPRLAPAPRGSIPTLWVSSLEADLFRETICLAYCSHAFSLGIGYCGRGRGVLRQSYSAAPSGAV